MLILSSEQVARMRLISQGLIDPLPTAAEAARWLTCTQGQDYPGSTVSLALRSSSRSTAAVREAYDAGTIVRSWPMRGTLFAVAAEDLNWILDLTAGQTLKASERRRRELGLDSGVLERAETVALRALAGPGLTRSRLLAQFAQEGLPVDEGRGYHLIFFLALRGVLCFGPTEGREQRIVLATEWIGSARASGVAPGRLPGRERDREDGVRELLLRYLRSHGPATVEDFCWWSKIGKTPARAALADLQPDLLSADVDGREHWMVPDLPDRHAERARTTAAPILLPGFDEIVLGYQDRSAVLTRDEEALVVPGRNGVFKGTVLHRGHAVGTWKRPTRRGQPVEVTAFGELPGPVARAVPRLSAALPV
ncbi:winged helix DNA-binding domain-containing protein [Citricoccus sp. K5]|uniref:winged helix DNA-binding domain-containing protein n=1 Tax=Citricoccus sp. K5 TaxID=2653135 RepID=UPI0012F10FA1|nr:winged helix DNA-binding domain-containing protein [Citricoccus sp. K5]VXC05645.1 Winged helix DNA-binding protein [Citricoccus sp. K5]